MIPIYHRDELVGFADASAHLLDIGGAYPGLNINAIDIYAEGNIYRAVKLAQKGVRQDGLWRHILENMRTPTPNEGDIQAMIAACELARRRYLDLIERYGLGAVEAAGRHWMDYSEQMLRREIAKIPDGEYETAMGFLDDDGVNRGRKLPVKVKAVIEGDEITYDLTGSSDEVPTGYNVPFEGTTCSAMSFITRMIFLDIVTYPVHVPQNEGMTRPIKVIAPKGSIFNPRSRAPASLASARCSAPSTWCYGRSPRWCRRRSRPATRRTCTSSRTPASMPTRASTGSTSRSTRAPTASGPAATAWTPWIASSRIPATTRSRSWSGVSHTYRAL